MKYYFINILFCLNFFQIQAQSIDCPKPIIVGEGNQNNYQVIYPLGWSEKGDFAYIHQDINAYAGGGGFQYNFIVQNMKTDEVVFEKGFYYNNNNVEYTWKSYSTNIDSLANKKMAFFDYAFFKTIVWSKIRVEISDAITKYKIKTTYLSLNNVLDLKEKGITIYEKIINNPITDHFTIDYKIILDSEAKGKKMIYHWHCDDKDKSCLNNYYSKRRYFVIKGYFRNPFENRIAIIVFLETNGYGEINEFPLLVGANLENGYDKTLTNKK